MAYTKEQAWELLTQYNKGEFHLKHANTVADVMRWYAEKLGYGDEADFWEIVGLLHDLDFEMYPDEHCIKSQEIMRENGLDERLIRATASHGYGLHFDGLPEPQHEMEKVLFATDELTGLIGAVALMRPSKSVSDLEVKSVKKKYKDKKFAAGCSREVIERGAEMLGWDLDTLIEQTILAMRGKHSCRIISLHNILPVIYYLRKGRCFYERFYPYAHAELQRKAPQPYADGTRVHQRVQRHPHLRQNDQVLCLFH